MDSLPTRIAAKMKEVDVGCADLQHLSLNPDGLRMIRTWENDLCNLLASMAAEMQKSKRNELYTYIARRTMQAEKFREARQDDGMTQKDAEEVSRLLVGDKAKEEARAAAYMEALWTLRSALIKKIEFVQNVANDIKHLDKITLRAQ